MIDRPLNSHIQLDKLRTSSAPDSALSVEQVSNNAPRS